MSRKLLSVAFFARTGLERPAGKVHRGTGIQTPPPNTPSAELSNLLSVVKFTMELTGTALLCAVNIPPISLHARQGWISVHTSLGLCMGVSNYGED